MSSQVVTSVIRPRALEQAMLVRAISAAQVFQRVPATPSPARLRRIRSMVARAMRRWKVASSQRWEHAFKTVGDLMETYHHSNILQERQDGCARAPFGHPSTPWLSGRMPWERIFPISSLEPSRRLCLVARSSVEAEPCISARSSLLYFRSWRLT